MKFDSAVDMKVGNISLGLETASIKHPCTWCEMSKDHFLGDRKTPGSKGEEGLVKEGLPFDSSIPSLVDEAVRQVFGDTIRELEDPGFDMLQCISSQMCPPIASSTPLNWLKLS